VAIVRRKLNQIERPPGLRTSRARATTWRSSRAKLAGSYSIHINDQWRVVFGFANGQGDRVQVTDYH
jgi:plasmid maintenance system killer protein